MSKEALTELEEKLDRETQRAARAESENWYAVYAAERVGNATLRRKIAMLEAKCFGLEQKLAGEKP